jgi:hypothetical protein
VVYIKKGLILASVVRHKSGLHKKGLILASVVQCKSGQVVYFI